VDNFKIGAMIIIIVCSMGFSGFVVFGHVLANEVIFELKCQPNKSGLVCHIKNLTGKTILCVGEVDGYAKEVLIRPHGRSRYASTKTRPVIEYCRVR
jgi:hypothetical protein